MGDSGSMIRTATASVLTMLLAGCVAPSAPPSRPALAAPPVPTTRIAVPSPPAGEPVRSPTRLAERIVALGQGFDGTVGIAVRDVDAGWTISYNGQRRMPQQSVSKFWVALTVLDAVDRGVLTIDQSVTVTRADLTLFHQPIAARLGTDGFHTTLSELMTIALTMSDNTANDVLLRLAGGPDAVRSFLARKGLTGVRFGPGEARLQSLTAGLTWRPEWSGGAGFLAARAALPLEKRQAALQRYLADPIDGAQPEAVVDGLARLRKGELLLPASTRFLLATMAQSHTGPQRLRGGVAPGWGFVHKTGTGQELGTLATGYNDVGIITAPGGHSYAVAVMIASTRQSIPVRQQLMQNVSRAIVAFQQNGG